MAKIALVLVFSLIMVLSIRSVLGDDAPSPEQGNKATSKDNGAAQSMSSAAGNAAGKVKETASSWTAWAKDKLRSYGLLSPKPLASAPANAPAPAHNARSFGPGAVAAPMA